MRLFTTIQIEGALLTADLLKRILDNDRSLGGLAPADYHLVEGERLNEAASRAWSRLTNVWKSFRAAVDKADPSDPLTGLTRDRWLLPLFQELGYGRLQPARGIEIEGKLYPVSHVWQNTPIHLVGYNVDPDTRTAHVPGAARASPHGMLQDLLNRDDRFQWGFVSNGRALRILRDSARLTRQAYIEFDLDAIFSGEAFSDFMLLWLVCHQSRVELPAPGAGDDDKESCWLERWSRAAQQQGERARRQLSDGVRRAIERLGQGFLACRPNTALRARLRAGALDAQDYYRQLLRLVYRLLFLFVAEDRGALLDPQADALATQRYARYYSTARLRALAGRHAGTRHTDLYRGFRVVTDALSGDAGCPALGLPALGGFLFSARALPDLETSEIANADFLAAIRALAFLSDRDARLPVDYRNLGADELGSVYESLLELRPVINVDAAGFALLTTSGSERKTSGTYYTHPDLVAALLDSTLEPALEAAVASGEWRAASGEQGAGSGETLSEEEKRYVYQVLSGSGGVAAGNAAGRAGVSADTALPARGTVRADLADSPGSQLGAGQHRGGLGARDNGGVSALSEDRAGQSARAGDASAAVAAGGAGDAGSSAAAARSGRDPGPATAEPATQPYSEARFLTLWAQASPALRRSLLASHALLSLRVCDPACGSGQFLIAAAHRIAARLAAVETGDAEPSPAALQHALRRVVGRCIFGVDINPLAVELCKFGLWLASVEPGRPLTFLDQHIQCGNSLIGATPALLRRGLPDAAFTALTGDDARAVAGLRRRNAQVRDSGQISYLTAPPAPRDDLSAVFERIYAVDDSDRAGVRAREQRHAQAVASADYARQTLLADAWCAAFVMRKTPATSDTLIRAAITQETLDALAAGVPQVVEALRPVIERLKAQYQFFHWHLAFPDVFRARPADAADDADDARGWAGGFDAVVGNPPWERIKLQEKEWFAARRPDIANAPNAATRKRMIAALREHDPALYAAFMDAAREAEGESHFFRNSGRYPLTAVGDVNTYALFAELARQLIAPAGRAGLIVPTGIATDDTTSAFFGDLSQSRAIASLFDFENREKLFPDVDSRMKFSLLTMTGAPVRESEFVFFATRVEHLRDARRRFTLAPEEIGLFNPNTRTMPVFRTRADAELTRRIYQRVPVLARERRAGDRQAEDNPWGVRFMAMFHMSNDSALFATEPRAGYLPLYEAKLFHQFDHRWATYEDGEARDVREAEKQDPHFAVRPRYWVPADEVMQRTSNARAYSAAPGEAQRPRWLMAFRDITNSTNERTVIVSVLPQAGVSNKAPVLFVSPALGARHVAAFLANVNSLPLDYVARQKLGGTSINFFILKQFPVLPPDRFTSSDMDFIVPRVVELVYTAWDVQAFAQDVLAEVGRETWNRWFPARALAAGEQPAPFAWDAERRAHLRAELDAYYAKLYGLTRDDLRYILDPQDVYGPDFPGETFRVLKERETRLYGEYRTGRLVLEKWDEMWG